MQIADILQHKGSHVVTILPSDTIANAARRLTENHIGALIVRDRWGHVVGMLSERDIVWALARHGAETLGYGVADLMISNVITCRPDDEVRDVMALITTRRIRHVPVMDGDRLAGIVSIGDVLKSRLDEKEHEVNVLRDINLVRG